MKLTVTDREKPMLIDINSVSELVREIYPDDKSWVLKMGEDLTGEFLYLPFEKCLLKSRSLEATCLFIKDEEREDGKSCFLVNVIANNPPDDGDMELGKVALQVDRNHLLLDSVYMWNHKGEFLNDKVAVGSTPARVGVLYTFAIICAYAAWLMGWKNHTELREIPITRQQRRHAERKGLALEETRVLNIEPWLRQYRLVSQSKTDSNHPMPLHMVRGHRITYTPQNPMFNCQKCKTYGHKDGMTPHTGTFWVSPHYKGTKEIGLIHHKYSVNASGGAYASN